MKSYDRSCALAVRIFVEVMVKVRRICDVQKPAITIAVTCTSTFAEVQDIPARRYFGARLAKMR